MQSNPSFYIGAIFAFFLIASFWGFWQAVHPQKITSNITPKGIGWIYEDILLETEDKLKLSAWFVPSDNKDSKVAVILLHGYPSDKGDLLDWAAFLKRDYNLLFLDFRYFGKSEGKLTSLGINETKDVLAAISYLKEKGVEDIGLMGFSFGASVALLTLPHTQDVKVVVADSPFANLDVMGKVYYNNVPLLTPILMSLTKLWANLIYGLDAQKAAVDKVIQGIDTPILIFASKEDDVVSIENTQLLQESLKDNPNAKVVIFDRGKHGVISGENYQKTILEFFEKNL